MTAALKLGVLWCDSSVIFLFVAKLQNSIFVKLSEYVKFGLDLHPLDTEPWGSFCFYSVKKKYSNHPEKQ